MPSSNGIVYFAAGVPAGQQYLLGLRTPTKMTLHLIGTDMTITHGTDAVALAAAEVAAGDGYAPIDLPVTSGGAEWTITGISAGGKAVYADQTWTLTAARSIWGYWYDDSAGDPLMGEMFAGGAYVIPSTGGLFIFTPSFTLTSQP